MNSIKGALGMCVRSGNCTFGYDKTLEDIKKGKTKLVLIGDNASDATKKRINDKCRFYNVDIIEIKLDDVIDELKLDESIKIISINDVNFKKLIYKKLKGDT